MIENLSNPSTPDFVRSVQGSGSPATLSVSEVKPWTAIVGIANNRGVGGTFTWGNITKNYEGTANSVDNSGASTVSANGGASQSFTAAYSGALDNLKAAVVGWI